MKETVNASIGSEPFTLDEDAYDTLKSYLDDIRIRLPENDTETMSDIEVRLAEIFREKIGAPTMRVITTQTVREAMEQMGAPSDFGELCNDDDRECPKAAPRRFYRSRTDRSIAGICGGLAEYFHLDPTLVRLATLLLILCGGISIWIYIILWIVIPEKPQHFDLNKNKRTTR